MLLEALLNVLSSKTGQHVVKHVAIHVAHHKSESGEHNNNEVETNSSPQNVKVEKKSTPQKVKYVANGSIEEKVTAIIVDKLGVGAEEVVPEATIQQDLGADSLDLVDLVCDFEREFNIRIPEEDTENIKTVGDAINYIKRHRS